RVRLLELVRGRAIDHPANELGHSEELLRAWREACRLVEQGRLRIRVAFEDINRLLVVPDVELKLQRARLLLCRSHKLWYQRRELVHLIDGNGEHPVPLLASHPCLHGTVPQGSHDGIPRGRVLTLLPVAAPRAASSCAEAPCAPWCRHSRRPCRKRRNARARSPSRHRMYPGGPSRAAIPA